MPLPDPESNPASKASARQVRRVVWGLVLLVALVIPLRVMALGYLPGEEALRFAAHAADGRPWGDVLVLGAGGAGNPQPAWETLLRGLHGGTGWGAGAILTATVCALFAAVILAPLIRSRAPEAWIAAWMILWVSGPAPHRFLQGGPYLLVVAVFLALLALGYREEGRGGGHRAARAGLAAMLFMTAALAHESWYVLAVVPFAFLLAGRPGVARDYLFAWLTGTTLAGLVSGHPGLLWKQISGMRWVMNAVMDRTLPNLDLGSLTPFGAVVIAMGAITLGPRREARSLFKDPVLVCVVLFWILGFHFQVLWLDWAFPAAVLWFALRLEPFLAALGERAPLIRLQVAAYLCLGLVLLVTVDQGGRWSASAGASHLGEVQPESRDWFPQPGGILYARDGQAFTYGYFHNPNAPWRYMVGPDPDRMPPQDKAIYLSIRADSKSPQRIFPWVARMRPEDRMCIEGGDPSPGDLGLEWHREASNVWLGRLPRK